MIIDTIGRRAVAGVLSAFALFAASAHAEGVGHPPEALYGASVNGVATALEGRCTTINIRQIDPPQVPGATTQAQIDCDGYGYFGAPRLAEFVFADDELLLIWILTEKSEEAALIDAFKAEYGEPTHDTDGMTAFANNRAAVRKDVPEALYYSAAIADLVRARFEQ